MDTWLQRLGFGDSPGSGWWVWSRHISGGGLHGTWPPLGPPIVFSSYEALWVVKKKRGEPDCQCVCLVHLGTNIPKVQPSVIKTKILRVSKLLEILMLSGASSLHCKGRWPLDRPLGPPAVKLPPDPCDLLVSHHSSSCIWCLSAASQVLHK